jgi:hypothetical protein
MGQAVFRLSQFERGKNLADHRGRSKREHVLASVGVLRMSGANQAGRMPGPGPPETAKS